MTSVYSLWLQSVKALISRNGFVTTKWFLVFLNKCKITQHLMVLLANQKHNSKNNINTKQINGKPERALVRNQRQAQC